MIGPRSDQADARGFGLVEVLAGLALAGILLVGVMGLFQSSVVKRRLSDETTRATVLAAERIELLSALPVAASELYPGTSTEQLAGNYSRTTFIRANFPAPGSKTIKVTVRRGESSRAVTVLSYRPRA